MSTTNNNEITNHELIQKILQHLEIDPKELIKLKKETLLILLEYVESVKNLLEDKKTDTNNKSQTEHVRACLSIVINRSKNINVITLTGYEYSTKISKQINSLTEEQIKVLAKHINKKIARSRETYFDFVTNPEKLTIDSFVESLKNDQEIKTNSNEINELMVLNNE